MEEDSATVVTSVFFGGFNGFFVAACGDEFFIKTLEWGELVFFGDAFADGERIIGEGGDEVIFITDVGLDDVNEFFIMIIEVF